MVRKLFAVVAVLAGAGVATAEPPSDVRVLANVNLPPLADATIVKSQSKKGLLLPLPGLGFVPVPVEVWECTVVHTPRNAPAGARPNRSSVRLLTLAE